MHSQQNKKKISVFSSNGRLCIHFFCIAIITRSQLNVTFRLVTPASYLGGLMFTSQPGHVLSCLIFLMVFSFCPGECYKSTTN
jgi:hypothetical protein